MLETCGWRGAGDADTEKWQRALFPCWASRQTTNP